MMKKKNLVKVLDGFVGYLEVTMAYAAVLQKMQADGADDVTDEQVDQLRADNVVKRERWNALRDKALSEGETSLDPEPMGLET